MINKIFKTIHNKYSKFFKFLFFLKYVFAIFLTALLLFLSIPKFFNYEKKQEILKEYLIEYYDLELTDFSSIEYKIFPLPNLSFKDLNLKVKNTPILLNTKNFNIFLNYKNIYNYENFEAKKILFSKSQISLNIDKTRALLNYFKNLKYKLNIKSLNLNLEKKNDSLVKIKNIYFSNYGYNKYKITGYLFDKKFKAILKDRNKSFKFKLLNTGIKANFKLDEENLTNSLVGSSKISLLNNILRFDFYLDKDKIKIFKSNFRNKKLSFSLDSLIDINPYFKIDTKIDINEIDTNFIESIDLDQILENKEIIKKMSVKADINYKNKKFFSNLIKDHSSNIDLIHGRIVYSNKTFIEEGEIICKGESELTSEYPRLSFVCSIDIQNKKELFKKLSISKKINKEPVSLYIEGSLNLLNRKINFKNINIDKDKILEEDKIYFKEIFEKILFDEGFFKIFNKKKIKNFILEIN